MKKIALISLLLICALALTACGGPATFDKVDTSKYLTLGEYKGLTYTPADTSVSEYELTVALNNALNEKGYAKKNEDVNLKEGTVQLGDTLNINYKGLKDGVAFQGGTASNQELTIGSGQFIGGFEEGLVGKKIGSDVKLNLTFPEDYGNAELAGQAVVFEVKINSVVDRVDYSELTDEIAAKLDEDAKSAKEYMANLKTDLENEKKSEAESALKNTLWNTAISNTTFKDKLPKKLIESATQEFKNYYEAAATQNGYDSLEKFITAQGATMDSFNAQAKNYGTSIVKSQLTAYAIAKAEGFAADDAFINKSATAYASQYGYSTADKYISAVGKDAVRDQAMLDYAVELVIKNAKAK